MRQSIVVFDDVFDTTDSLSHLIDNKLEAEDWYDLDADHPYKKFCRAVLDIAGVCFNLDGMIGYEFWGHHNSGTDWHYDKDEVLWNNTGELDFPLCSTAYYLDVNDLQGGHLVLEDNIITPKTNRLVIFSPGMPHTVNKFSGKRVSLLVNPWSHKICQ